MKYSELALESSKIIESSYKELARYEKVILIASRKLSSSIREFINKWPNSLCPIQIDSYKQNITILGSTLNFDICWDEDEAFGSLSLIIKYSWEHNNRIDVSGIIARYMEDEIKWFISRYPDKDTLSEWRKEIDENYIPLLLLDFAKYAAKNYLTKYRFRFELKI